MTGHLPPPWLERTRWAIVMGFAIAMAWVEAASVFYLRALIDRVEPYQADPLPMNGALGNVELWREAATLVMIATLGLLAGRTWRRRGGYAALAFGAWDIFYYVFLRLISGWPRTLLDWDILFLLPLPWWGPVLAPVSIALVMILWGTIATQSGDGTTDARWHGRSAGSASCWRSASSRSTPGGLYPMAATRFCECCRRGSTGRCSGWPCC